jgi:hypothetical protein
MDISVAIGRNVGDSPMHLVTWHEFQDELDKVVQNHGFTIKCSETGQSRYIYQDSVEQEATYRIWANRDDSFPYGAWWGRFKDDLGQLAAKYQQWGIALSTVQTDIVEGADNAGR